MMAPGDVIDGRFELLALAARGGAGVVYRAFDRVTRQQVAIKLFDDRSGPALERFYREASILAELRHPGIVRYLSRGEAPDGAFYLVTEWLAGEELAQRLERGALEVPEAVALVRRLAQVVGFAHARGVIHRDIKPQNIFLPKGELTGAKLLDFGLARGEDPTAAKTQTGMIMGTPGYMAPEQASVGAKGLDPRADVFALGCLLFECLTGAAAFTGENALAVIAKTLHGPTPSARAQRPEVPAELDALLARMLGREPADRPADGQAVALELAALDKSRAGTTPAPDLVAGETVAVTLTPRALRALWAALVALLVAVAALGEWVSVCRFARFADAPSRIAARGVGLLRALGYAPAGTHVAWRMEFDRRAAYRQGMSAGAPIRWGPASFSPLRVWVRVAPVALTPREMFDRDILRVPMRYLYTSGAVRPGDPALEQTGGAALRIGSDGRLWQLMARVPDGAAPRGEPDFRALLDAAGLGSARLSVVAPRRAPGDPSAVPADREHAWEDPATGLRVEAASARGWPVYFEVFPPWRPVASSSQISQQFGDWWSGSLWVAGVVPLVLLASALYARRNVRQGRGDPRGAARLAGVVFALMLAQWLLGASHASSGGEADMLLTATCHAAGTAAMTGMLYLALEPAVRRRWPEALIAWSRVMQGWRHDPLVGRDVLVGVVLGLASAALRLALVGILGRAGIPSRPLGDYPEIAALGAPAGTATAVIANANYSLVVTPGLLFVLQLARSVLRRDAAALVAVALLFGVVFSLASPLPSLLANVIDVTFTLAVLRRFGLLCAVVSYAVAAVGYFVPVAFAPWALAASLAPLAFVLALAVLGTLALRARVQW